MDELLEQFLIEGRDLVGQAHADLERLAIDPADAVAIDSAFRAVHTLKGSVAIFALDPAERLLHAAEDLLHAVRGSAAALPDPAREALVACIDQTDRWIDRIERSGGTLDDAADAIAARLIARLKQDAAPPTPAPPPQAVPAWLEALMTRERSHLAAATGALVAFRYAPDADCFFRGEDPLAVVAGVPDLTALAILPAATWPTIDAWDPFRCTVCIEGLSAAPRGRVQAVFRLVPDQITIVPIAPETIASETMASETMAPEPSTAEPAQPGSASTMRVDAARIDALADGLGALIVAVNALDGLVDQAGAADRRLAADLRTAQSGIARALARMQQAIAAVRLVPLAGQLRRLPRIVREIADGLGKPIAFELAGETLEVDKQIADGLFEPLLHLVRNAIDHGIEPAEGRAASGKAAAGRIRVAASREGEEAVITLSDDGGGIDLARVRAVAIARGLIDADSAATLPDAQALQLIFAPGFSTAAAVTDLSGRGVGMDAVRSAVERLRGRIDVETAAGAGTAFRLRFPLNAITTRLLVVEAAGARYGVPLDQVTETARLDSSLLRPLGSGTACVLRGRTLPVISLAGLLGADEPAAPTTRLLVSHAAGEPIALRVGRFAARIDAVVRRRSGLLAAVRGVAGTAVLGDGSVLLVLDLAELAA